jgi:hypothetical protein
LSCAVRDQVKFFEDDRTNQRVLAARLDNGAKYAGPPVNLDMGLADHSSLVSSPVSELHANLTLRW